MQKIKIITDSTSDLPRDLIEKYDIEVMPLIVNFGETSYRDGVDLELTEFLNIIENTGIFPTTAQINPHRFYECYKKYLDGGYKIVSLHLSSKMSGTYQSACIAKDMLETEDIIVIDSYNVTAGLGVLVLEAHRLKEQGAEIFEIEEKIKKAIPHVKSSLCFESLEHLVKGGRLSKTAGVIGNLLGIKLILAVEDGEMVVRDKVRGTKKAIRTITEYFDERKVTKAQTSILLKAALKEQDKEIFNAVREHLETKETKFIESEVGCVVGTHSGARACGVFFIEDYL